MIGSSGKRSSCHQSSRPWVAGVKSGSAVYEEWILGAGGQTLSAPAIRSVGGSCSVVVASSVLVCCRRTPPMTMVATLKAWMAIARSRLPLSARLTLTSTGTRWPVEDWPWASSP